jgi:hypothetical protein
VTDSREIGVSLLPPQKVEKLQAALHTKAKNSPDYRFYALYDKVYRWDVLAVAYTRCRENGGAPGVDGQTFEDIAEHGVFQWLSELVTVTPWAGITTAARASPIWGHDRRGRKSTGYVARSVT